MAQTESFPFGGLIFDAAGNLYGTTAQGGSYTGGTVFELTPSAGGGWTEQVLYSLGNNGTGALSQCGPDLRCRRQSLQHN